MCARCAAPLAGRTGQAGQEGRGIPHREGEWRCCTQARSQDGTKGHEQVQAPGCEEDGAQEQQEDNGQAQPQGRKNRQGGQEIRSEEHTSELQSLMRISYAVFCLKKKNTQTTPNTSQ